MTHEKAKMRSYGMQNVLVMLFIRLLVRSGCTLLQQPLKKAVFFTHEKKYFANTYLLSSNVKYEV